MREIHAATLELCLFLSCTRKDQPTAALNVRAELFAAGVVPWTGLHGRALGPSR